MESLEAVRKKITELEQKAERAEQDQKEELYLVLQKQLATLREEVVLLMKQGVLTRADSNRAQKNQLEGPEESATGRGQSSGAEGEGRVLTQQREGRVQVQKGEGTPRQAPSLTGSAGGDRWQPQSWAGRAPKREGEGNEELGHSAGRVQFA